MRGKPGRDVAWSGACGAWIHWDAEGWGRQTPHTHTQIYTHKFTHALLQARINTNTFPYFTNTNIHVFAMVPHERTKSKINLWQLLRPRFAFALVSESLSTEHSNAIAFPLLQDARVSRCTLSFSTIFRIRWLSNWKISLSVRVRSTMYTSLAI